MQPFFAKGTMITFIIFLTTPLAARLATLAWKRHRRASHNKRLTGASQTNARSRLLYSAAATVEAMASLLRSYQIPDISSWLGTERWQKAPDWEDVGWICDDDGGGWWCWKWDCCSRRCSSSITLLTIKMSPITAPCRRSVCLHGGNFPSCESAAIFR